MQSISTCQPFLPAHLRARDQLRLHDVATRPCVEVPLPFARPFPSRGLLALAHALTVRPSLLPKSLSLRSTIIPLARAGTLSLCLLLQLPVHLHQRRWRALLPQVVALRVRHW